MTELTGLELQKAACEALGWTDVTIQEDCCVGFPPNSTRTHPGQLRRLTEVSEDDFLEWCEKSNLCWILQTATTDEGVVCQVYSRDGSEKVRVLVYGSTPSEARERAIVEASHV